MLDGRGPLNKLLHSDNTVSSVRFPIWEGNWPAKEFSLRSNSTNFGKFEITDGIFPLNLLYRRCSWTICERFPMELGEEPESPQPDTSKYFKNAKELMELGIPSDKKFV